jgi:beta-lactamase class C
MLAYQTIANAGKYKLNDPVTKHLLAVIGQKGKDINKVTLQDLATHTASFPHSSSILGADLFKDQAPSTDLINFWETFKAPSNDPIGSQYIYADIGFVTLGYAVAGNAYNTFLQSTINKPLGLTQFGSAMMMPKGAVYAQGHLDKHGQTTAIDTLNTDLMASLADYMTYLKAHMGLLKLPSALQAAMRLTQKKAFSTPASTKIDLGLSWQLVKQAPHIIDKDGASSKGGCQSYIGFIPGTRNGAVVLMNKFFMSQYPNYGATSLGRKVLAVLAAA